MLTNINSLQNQPDKITRKNFASLRLRGVVRTTNHPEGPNPGGSALKAFSGLICTSEHHAQSYSSTGQHYPCDGSRAFDKPVIAFTDFTDSSVVLTMTWKKRLCFDRSQAQ